MKKIVLLVIFSFIFFSCKKDNLIEVLKTSKNPEIDMVFYTVAKAELKINPSISIVDKASDKNSHLYWNQNLLPDTDFMSSDTLNHYYKNETKFWKFVKKQEYGWIKFSEPKFSNNKNDASIYVDFLRPTLFFGVTQIYYLKKVKGKYQIIKVKRVSIS
jgi:hypothetical protein